ncbi:UDP-N-acetylmuramate--L-alanine ligase [Candidatus Peregrinibacteria bacterium]|nr:UDP-N-acetylmuramate--L-alanine ligase [Candidatus Peregrinibacteria bacterium]
MTTVHFIGIGGIGVSALAQIYKSEGKIVSGSDMQSSEISAKLKEKGIGVHIGHSASNIPKNCDLVIYSPAIPESNVELEKAQSLGIKIFSYPQALGTLTEKYFTIAVAGTHGKSTTTAMIAVILEKAGFDPTVVIGTKIPQFNNENYRIGKSKYLVLEACEYRESFLAIKPEIAIITNIEADHLDYFKNERNYSEAFHKFLKNIKPGGKLISSKSIGGVKNIPPSSLHIKLQIPGSFNLENARLAAAVCQELGVKDDVILAALKSFQGTWRRMENKGKILGETLFIDDYAHHPTEVEVTLGAIREKYPKARILTAFQPHQYNRTKNFLPQFAISFNDTDTVLISDIYAVRDSEEDLASVKTEDLVEAIAKNHPQVVYGHDLKQTAEYIKKNYQKYDVIVTMGAGSIYKIYDLLMSSSKLSQRTYPQAQSLPSKVDRESHLSA